MQTTETFAQLESGFHASFSHIELVTEIGNLRSDLEIEVGHISKGIAKRDTSSSCRKVLTQSLIGRIK